MDSIPSPIHTTNHVEADGSGPPTLPPPCHLPRNLAGACHTISPVFCDAICHGLTVADLVISTQTPRRSGETTDIPHPATVERKAAVGGPVFPGDESPLPNRIHWPAHLRSI